MYSLIIFLPLLGAIISGFFGRFLGYNGAAIITTSAMILATIFSYVSLYNLITEGNPVYIKILNWFDSALFEASWGFQFDSLSVIMLIVVTTISTLVHLYSTEYMAGDPHIPRFMSYLSFFTFCMLMLVTADNFIQLFFGWEGVGISSYLLINFWFTRVAANKAAIKAIIVNRVGDFGLTLGILCLFLAFKAVDYSTIFALVPYLKNETSLITNIPQFASVFETPFLKATSIYLNDFKISTSLTNPANAQFVETVSFYMENLNNSIALENKANVQIFKSAQMSVIEFKNALRLASPTKVPFFKTTSIYITDFKTSLSFENKVNLPFVKTASIYIEQKPQSKYIYIPSKTAEFTAAYELYDTQRILDEELSLTQYTRDFEERVDREVIAVHPEYTEQDRIFMIMYAKYYYNMEIDLYEKSPFRMFVKTAQIYNDPNFESKQQTKQFFTAVKISPSQEIFDTNTVETLSSGSSELSTDTNTKDLGNSLVESENYILKPSTTKNKNDFINVYNICNENSISYPKQQQNIEKPNVFSSNIAFFGKEFNIFNIACLFLFIGAVGKSAQIGLHTWLPDAMEGPTPVSALIHAATMVTAGVFLLIRCSILFEQAPQILLLITFIGACTALFAATAGLLQNDLKKVIAYSTCSQLGYMVFACGISNYSVSIFHLMNHAFFKALLFLSAGSVIHAMADEQDMRKMGGLVNILPFTYSMILIGSLSLMGFPFLTGFYSKDVILELAFAKYTIAASFAYWLGTVAAFFTAFYSFRLIYLTFLSESNSYKKIMENAHDAPIKMAIPLGILVIGSIFVGFLTKDLIIGLGTDFWGNAITVLPQNLNIIDSEFLPYNIKLLPVCFSILGAITAFILNNTYDYILANFKLTLTGAKIYGFLNKKWFFDNIYNEFIVKLLLNFGYHVSFKIIDRGILEVLGPYGITKMAKNFTNLLNNLQTGNIYNYAFLMLMGCILFIILVPLGFLLQIVVIPPLYLVFPYVLASYSIVNSYVNRKLN